MAAFQATRFTASDLQPSENVGINPESETPETKKPCQNCLTVWEKWNALPMLGKVFLTVLAIYIVQRRK